MNIYQPSAKAIRKNSFKDLNAKKFRLIFRNNQSALLYCDGEVIESNLYYRKPDSHVELVHEQIPTSLKVDKYLLDSINDNQIGMFGIKLIQVDKLKYVSL